MRIHDDRREGFALAVALFAMVVIGALVAGAFFSSTQEFRIGRNTLAQAHALGVAEMAQNGVLADWTTDYNSQMKNGEVRTFETSGQGWKARALLTRANQTTFWLVSEGVAAGGTQMESRRRTGLLLRLARPEMNFRGGLTTRGGVNVTGSSLVDGRDTNPPGWDCPPTDGSTDMPGVAIPNPADVNNGGGCSKNCIGNPPVYQDPVAADTNTYFNYGDSDWNALKATARKLQKTQYTQVDPRYKVDGSCDKAHDDNWGDPLRANPVGACANYYPTMYAPGDLTINGTKGQGMLLVEGNLYVQGNFEFMGPVIVRGAAHIKGTGGQNAKFTGGIMAANVVLSKDDQSVTGNATVTYSRCALLTVLANTTHAVPARIRAWSDMF